MKIYIGFIVAASKMFFRRKSSIFWTLFFPVVIMLALGNFNFGAYSAPNVGLINNSTDQAASNISNALLKTSTVVVKNLESIAEGDAALEKGSIVAYIEIPDNFIKTEGKIEITTREGDKPELELVQNVVFVALSNANNTAFTFKACPVCLYVCLPSCMSVCLSVFMSVCMSVIRKRV